MDFTGSMPLPTPNHSVKKCGGPGAFTSTTIIKKYGVTISLGGLERYITDNHLELAYRIVYMCVWKNIIKLECILNNQVHPSTIMVEISNK